MKFDPYNIAHFVVMTLVTNACVSGLVLWLLFHGYLGGDTMPTGVKIWGVLFMYVVSAWYLISHRPKRHPPDQ